MNTAGWKVKDARVSLWHFKRKMLQVHLQAGGRKRILRIAG
jgi:hypothetical protein